MDKVISLLQSLFSLNKLASVTVPGVLTAAALAFLFRPTPPLDTIPTFEETDNTRTRLTSCQDAVNAMRFPVNRSSGELFQKCQAPSEPACKESKNSLQDTFGT